MILFILQYGENFDKLQNKLLAFVPDYQFKEIEETGLFVVDATAKDEEELEEEGSLLEIEESSSTSSELDEGLRINARIILKNSDPDGAVWIEARLSDTGVTFLDLLLVEGFPRWIKENEIVEIDLRGKKELLFRRGMYAFEPELKADEIRMCGYLYRIGNPRNLEVLDEIVVKKGSIHIRPHPTVATFMRERGFAAPFEIGIDLILNSKAIVD